MNESAHELTIGLFVRREMVPEFITYALVPRVPLIGETVDYYDEVMTVERVETCLFGENSGKIFVTITDRPDR